MTKIAGKHLILNLHGVCPKKLSNKNYIETLLLSSIKLSNSTILHHFFHPFGEDLGVTGIVAISESHVSIHTWPEWEYAAIDVFLCGENDPEVICKNLIEEFKPTHYDYKIIMREVKCYAK